MANIIFNWIVHWLLGWGGVSLLVALGAAAVWWFIPAIFTKVRALAFNVAIGALAFNSVFTMGYQNGASVTKAAWDAAEQRGIEHSADVRRQAEQEIEPVVEPVTPPEPDCPVAPEAVAPAPAKPRAVPVWMRNDRHNRDNH